jgi:hypothetical protein
VAIAKSQRRPADPLPLEMKIYVNVVGDLDGWNALVHAIILAIEDHSSSNLT